MNVQNDSGNWSKGHIPGIAANNIESFVNFESFKTLHLERGLCRLDSLTLAPMSVSGLKKAVPQRRSAESLNVKALYFFFQTAVSFVYKGLPPIHSVRSP